MYNVFLVVAHMLSTKKGVQRYCGYHWRFYGSDDRVNQSLNYGCDGYELVFSRLESKK